MRLRLNVNAKGALDGYLTTEFGSLLMKRPEILQELTGQINIEFTQDEPQQKYWFLIYPSKNKAPMTWDYHGYPVKENEIQVSPANRLTGTIKVDVSFS